MDKNWWKNNTPFGINDEYILSEKLLAHCDLQLNPLFLKPVLSQQRILDVFCAWKEDLIRSKNGNFVNEGVSPDHIKSAAHLTYWIRRESPLIDFSTLGDGIGMYSEIETMAMELDIEIDDLSPYSEITPKEEQNIKFKNGMTLAEFRANRVRVSTYGNELFAFTFGFNLAKAYEEQKLLEIGIHKKIKMPDGKYIEDLCYFFKFKSVSPHSIDLIYRALLKNFV